MATARVSTVMRWAFAVVLPLLAAASADAQTWVYPGYAPWGYPMRYYPSYPGPVNPPITRTSGSLGAGAVRTAAYAAAPDDSNSRPSYYSEDYSGPKGPTNEPSKVAYIRVRVPANAELWINSEKRAQAGATREFVTPALDPDHIYVYNVKARWTEEGGINVEKTLRVRTISGTRVTVNFVRPPASQPRRAIQQTATATPVPGISSSVQQRPISWTDSSYAPRSFRGPAE
jgi:uncharacterized protein (TIGR03000 family)